MNNKTTRLDTLTDDVLCALAARNELRREGKTVMGSPSEFLALFYGFSQPKKSTTEKQASEFERERRKKLSDYLAQSGLLINDVDGNPTLIDTH
jgi:hypothetical protein